MGSAILFYLIILPISKLPYFLLYKVSDFFFLVMYHLVGYRKKVVLDNLRKCFPDKSEREIKEISKAFYRHFCDLVVESLKNFSISSEEAQARMISVNPEVLNAYAERGQSVIIVGGHYANWELWAVAAPPKLKHQVVAIYKQLSNAFFDKKMRSSRGKFGLHLVSTKAFSDYFKEHVNDCTATVFAIDQSPSNPNKSIWIKFLGRDTATLFGAEKYATEYNRPVVYGKVRKVKRGYYTISYETVFENPSATQKGEITQTVHDILEQEIHLQPEFWLWSHKRWKHQKP
jgi:KDO2-lipid IV(A) lauroyltransferase